MRAAALAVAVLLVAAGCSHDGRELAEPSPDQTTTTPTTIPGDTRGPLGTFMLSSPAFADGTAMPASVGCPVGVSPPLNWANVPVGAVELALVVTDPDADDFVHWVVAGITPNSTGVDQGAVPTGGVETGNDAGTVGWTGPCPPEGETHTYLFRLLAFAEPVGLVAGVSGRQAVAALVGPLAEADLRGTFGH